MFKKMRIYGPMKRLVAISTILFLSLLGVLAAAKEERDERSPSFGIPHNTPIHYTGKYCKECHLIKPKKGGQKFLKFGGDFNQLCRCHLSSLRKYPHPVNIQPTPKIKGNIPSDFPLPKGKVTCLTCHDIYFQCQASRFREISLRGGPFSKRSDFCFKCHVKDASRRLNPHNGQLNSKGEIIREKCLYCHAIDPDKIEAGIEDQKFIGNLEMLCRRCHFIPKGEKHSGDADHMVKPSFKLMINMEKVKEQFNVIFPLNPAGEMTCVTCHNPHQKGVIPTERPGAKGAGSRFKHRLPGRICKECHQM